MGWGRMFLLGDIGQQIDIEEQRTEMRRLRRKMRAAKRAGESAEALRAQVDELENEVDELRLYIVALVRHLIGKGVLTREQLERWLASVDAEDGTADGGYKGPIG